MVCDLEKQRYIKKKVKIYMDYIHFYKKGFNFKELKRLKEQWAFDYEMDQIRKRALQ